MIQFTFFFAHNRYLYLQLQVFCLFFFFFLPELHYFFTLKLNCNKILPVLSEKVKTGKEIRELNSWNQDVCAGHQAVLTGLPTNPAHCSDGK